MTAASAARKLARMVTRLTPKAGPLDAPAIARRLLRSVPTASLATAVSGDAGWPYASLVALAVGHDGMPVLLLSSFSDHTRNLNADPRASLLLDGTHGLANRMAGERVTLMGRVHLIAQGSSRDHLRARYLRRHPGAEAYEGFTDFAFYAMHLERAHLIGGFAKAYRLVANDLLSPVAHDHPLVDAEASIIEHMNDDHRDTVQLYANVLARRPGRGWRITGIDRFGIDLRAGGAVARVAFERMVDDATAARQALMALAAHARADAPS